MNTKEMTRQQISALTDGELAGPHVDVALVALRQSEAQADWEIYHQIGDVLRSDDMVPLSLGFAARMAACLEAEPIIVIPVVTPATTQTVENILKRSSKRWALPSMAAAAAMAAIAFVTTPQLLVAIQSEPVNEEVTKVVSTTAGSEQGGVVAAALPEGVVLRDPRIDDYLLAHQRFSPSLYSSAQYARSATFSNK